MLVKQPPIKRKDVAKYLAGSVAFLIAGALAIWLSFAMPFMLYAFFVWPIIVVIYAIFNVIMFFANPERFYMLWLRKESKKEYIKLAVEWRVQKIQTKKDESEGSG